MNNKARLQTIRDSVIATIADILDEHSSDTMDVTDLGSTPVIWPDSDPEVTFTLDRINFDRGRTLVDSSSSFSNRTDRIEDISTDVLVDILDFLEDNEKMIWLKEDDGTECGARVEDIREDEDFIRETYLKEDVCMGDLLADMKISELPHGKDLTVEQVFNLYVIAKHKADGDEFYRWNDSCGENGEKIDLAAVASKNL